jgi:hypothetical protein
VGKIELEKEKMAALLGAGDLADLHKTQHKTMIRRTLLGAAVVLVALAYFDVSTGVQLLDQLVHAVPIDWLRRLVA